ncbi:class I SAM-dependent methyltransferase [Croceitalea sp. MTPC5]|uniref:class I SAM-dependent methyltransferase n=1 Tax=Croceitalea sp. MTPC5 TaxID=3056565 RepID=UPI002B3C8B54|nr:class I SAM-dependent methyltransferase [Croceitalea sp. MTPC5]
MKLYLKTKDYSVSHQAFELYHDEMLDMLVTQPQPKELSSYYESGNYISHTDSKRTLVDKIYQLAKTYSLKKKVRLLKSVSPNGRTLLDIGAGTGDFLLEAKKSNWTVRGIEPNQLARKNARDKGILLEENLENVSNEKYDVITLWHVLEHLPNLKHEIKNIETLLKQDGVLLVAVPNFKSFDAKHYKEFWAAYDVPRHLWHFSKNAITKLFEAIGMKVNETKPMKLDSFYVSMLSEKYKTGRQNLLKAFYIGLKSNLKANRTKEYSSHIYILEKSK